ncbi:MAG: hypothetical protein WCS96_13065 [Victivallales bacterium]
MLKLLFVAAIVFIVMALVCWVFMALADKAKKRSDDSQKLLADILEELKKINANNEAK